MNILSSAADAFTNPDSVWYYVIGVVFLVLIFAALAVYIVVSNKHKKNKESAPEENANDSTDDDAESKEPTEENAPVDMAEELDEVKPDDDEEKIDEVKAEEKTSETEEVDAATADDGAEPNNETVENNAEPDKTESDEPAPAEIKKESSDEKVSDDNKDASLAPKKRAPRKATTTVVKIVEEKQSEEKEKATAKPEKAETPAAAQSKPAKKTAAKPFIDRLLAAKTAHGVYNEIKNTVLSYPGMKAKLTKEDEQFIYVDKKMAAIELDGSSVVLYLALDPTAVPSQFTVEPTGDASLPVKMTVEERAIDGARRLVVFAMNVSMLTRNDKHRYVNYIQKAQDAKQRAKKK